jgi:hypothetical protein
MIFIKKFCQVLYCNVIITRKILYVFCEYVHKNKYYVIDFFSSSKRWKLDNEVHDDHIHHIFKMRNCLEFIIKLMSSCFYSLTKITSVAVFKDILCYIMSKVFKM